MKELEKSQTLHATFSHIQNALVAHFASAHHQAMSVIICDIELATVDTELSALKFRLLVSELYTDSF
jgi:hypothetical protein